MSEAAYPYATHLDIKFEPLKLIDPSERCGRFHKSGHPYRTGHTILTSKRSS
jgi:hypothetical protein